MTIPTYSNEIKSSIVLDYLSKNLTVLLINYPDLGTSATPSLEELELRRNLKFIDAVAREILPVAGYARSLVEPYTVTPTNNLDGLIDLVYTASFTAESEDFPEFTHVVVACQTEWRGAISNNGNNRGSITGKLISVEPTTISTLNTFESYIYEFRLALASRDVDF